VLSAMLDAVGLDAAGRPIEAPLAQLGDETDPARMPES